MVREIPIGTAVAITATSKVCMSTNHPGDRLVATVNAPVVGSNGAMIPAGSSVVLEVASVTPASSTDSAQIALRLKTIVVNDQSYAVSGDVTNLGPLQKVAVKGKSSDDRNKVIGGAVAGAILGQILGHSTKGTVIGAAAGGAAGAAVAAADKKSDECLPQGAPLQADAQTGDRDVVGGCPTLCVAFTRSVERLVSGSQLGEPSAPQRDGWPVIAAGEHTLILAPTGTGKTFAAFLWELNQLIVSGLDAPLANAVHILYISPLKALNNDVERNLRRPLVQLAERFAAAGHAFPEIRIAVRTGDTPASARARMLRKTPHILITTPESLHIMLTSVRGRGMFSGVRAVIVDEIHAVAGTKRGAHLSLTLERLERRCDQPPQRIGLSATQRPLGEIARFLGGARPVTVVDCGLIKRMDIRVESPVDDLNHVPAGTIWPAVAVARCCGTSAPRRRRWSS